MIQHCFVLVKQVIQDMSDCLAVSNYTAHNIDYMVENL